MLGAGAELRDDRHVDLLEQLRVALWAGLADHAGWRVSGRALVTFIVAGLWWA